MLMLKNRIDFFLIKFKKKNEKINDSIMKYPQISIRNNNNKFILTSFTTLSDMFCLLLMNIISLERERERESHSFFSLSLSLHFFDIYIFLNKKKKKVKVFRCCVFSYLSLSLLGGYYASRSNHYHHHHYYYFR